MMKESRKMLKLIALNIETADGVYTVRFARHKQRGTWVLDECRGPDGESMLGEAGCGLVVPAARDILCSVVRARELD